MSRALSPPPAGGAQFALRFRLLMSYHDLTLREVAAAAGCAVSTAGTWRLGRVPSSPQVLRRLAEIFHVSVHYLLDGRPQATPAEAAAGRILDDLDTLLQALADGPPGGRSRPHAGAPQRRR